MKQTLLRPSSATRWINCPASVKLTAKMPYKESGEAAKIGTAIHSLSEICHQTGASPFDFVDGSIEGIKISKENAEYAQQHIDEIKAIEGITKSLLVEQYLTAHETPAIKVGGTADVIAWDDTTIIVADLKTGKGFVDADSDQMKIYAIGAINKVKHKIFKDVELRVIQPHHGPVRTHKMSVDELLIWKEDVLIPAAEEAIEDTPPTITEAGCQWCPAKPICPAHKQSFDDLFRPANEFKDTKALPVMTEAELAKYLDQVSTVEAYISALRDYAAIRIKDGAVVVGWQMGPKRATRKWVNEADAVAMLVAAGLSDDQIYSTEMISPSVAEKLLGKENKSKLDDYTKKESSGLTLQRDAGLSI